MTGERWTTSTADRSRTRSRLWRLAGALLLLGGCADFDGISLESAGLADSFVAKLGPDGSVRWARRFGDATAEVAHALAVAPDDTVYVAGRFARTIDFGGDVLDCAGNDDLFLAQLSATGGHLFSRCFGNSGNHYPAGLAVTEAGEVLITGYMDGSISFGGAELSEGNVDGAFDIFVAKLAP